MEYVISGIQQMGVGIPNVHEAFAWYRKAFGADIKVFEEAAEANLMLPYTGGKPHSRSAILALNMEGGGGFEIWQYTSRKPVPPKIKPVLGDYGLNLCKIKTRNASVAHKHISGMENSSVSDIYKNPCGDNHFYVLDPYGNYFEVVESSNWFSKDNKATGSVYGSVIGVSDIEKSKEFYKNILGYDTVIADESSVFDDYSFLPEGNQKYRRVILKHSQPRIGGFSKLLGESQIELVQKLEGSAKKIFENRYWGDLGFIHLCFDINGMDALRKHCEKMGSPFTVDSAASEKHEDTFDMGEAAGHFSYIEDPDGSLIEFVETHKVPIMKKLGLYLNMKKRDPKKNLPNYIIKAMKVLRVKG